MESQLFKDRSYIVIYQQAGCSKKHLTVHLTDIIASLNALHQIASSSGTLEAQKQLLNFSQSNLQLKADDNSDFHKVTK